MFYMTPGMLRYPEFFQDLASLAVINKPFLKNNNTDHSQQDMMTLN